MILTSTGTVEQALSFDAWGLRRTATNGASLWSPLNTASLTAFDHSKTTKGFTGHEMIDEVGIIHMGGRIYDPRIGRFLQADPTMQLPTNTQNYNRYSYVINNPLTYTDPTGYNIFGRKLGHMFDGFGESVEPVQLILTVVCIVATEGAGTAGCVAASAAAGVKTHGGSWGDALKAGAIAYASAWAFNKIGGYYGEVSNTNLTVHGTYYYAGIHAGEALWLTPAQMVGRIAMEAAAGGVMSTLSGGKFGDGFVGAGLSAGFAPYLQSHIDSAVGQVAAAAALGGTVSELTGGKFANGAMAAAFQTLFNELGGANAQRRYQGNLQSVNLPGIGDTYLDCDFVTNVDSFISNAKAGGVDLEFNSAYRSSDYQAELRNDPNAITPAATSLHSAGLAVDVNYTSLRNIPGGLTGDQQRQVILNAARQSGLSWGGSFRTPDLPHFYIDPGTDRTTLINNASRSLNHGN